MDENKILKKALENKLKSEFPFTYQDEMARLLKITRSEIEFENCKKCQEKIEKTGKLCPWRHISNDYCDKVNTNTDQVIDGISKSSAYRTLSKTAAIIILKTTSQVYGTLQLLFRDCRTYGLTFSFLTKHNTEYFTLPPYDETDSRIITGYKIL